MTVVLMADVPAVFQRCNALAEQRDVLVSYMAGKAQIPGQVCSQTPFPGILSTFMTSFTGSNET